MTTKYIIKLINLHKAFGPKVISRDLNLSIVEGEFLAIIGRSGEGKSVLLKQMIGLIKPDSGTVIVDDTDLTTAKGHEAQDKVFQSCGYVFQFAALLDSLSVAENVGITLIEAGMTEKEVLPLVKDKLLSVGLDPAIASRYPSELSGGMKKRVGLARTLMRRPKILIYDEPTTGLDPISVRMIHELMRKTHDENKTTTVVISHDPDVFNYADRVAMLHEGRILYVGDAKTIWQEENPYIHQFIRGLSQGPITMISEKAK
ncbi:MAG: phospholipid/cholesterol/gamma-HCH transport system ATP-binding protein [Candidatus Dependentiae bacterium]|nr:phospholipid/cholesterol/gamma-HCH transport system ATP-binding protein [Candidatus Dependentiae bacterium]